MRRKILIGVILVVILLCVAGYFTRGLLAHKVGLCLNGTDGSLRDALAISGYTVLSRNSENDQELQKRQVAELLKEKVDVLVVQLVDTDAAAQILQLAVEVPVIFVGEEPKELGKGYYVGSDVAQQGVAQARMLERFFTKADINGDRLVDYMVISGPEELPQSQVYLQSVAAAMEGKAVALLEEAGCQSSAEEARTLCREAFSKYGRDLELILCNDASVAQGAVKAIEDGRRQPGKDVIIFAVGTEAQLRSLVDKGHITAAVMEDTSGIHNRIAGLIETLQKEEAAEQKQYIDYKIYSIDGFVS